MHSFGQHTIPGKSICVPAAAPVDVSGLIPIIDHPYIQKLRARKQLGVNYLVFPGAVHTRFEHAVGTLALTQHMCHVHRVPEETTRHLCAFALLHDVGHGPFSHQIEPVAGGDHKARGVGLLADMADELSQCGLDIAQLRRMFSGDNALGQLVSDRNLGTDKLDYLRRDALHIGFTGMPDVETIQYYTAFDEGSLAIEEKFIGDIKRVQKFYSYLHQHGYLNKTALSIQRLFQRAVQEELAQGTATADQLWDMTDDELVFWLKGGQSALARSLVSTFEDRSFHRSVLVIRPVGYGFVERRSGKGIKVREWSREKIRVFSERYSCCERLLELENALAALLDLPAGTVLFAAMPYFEKLVPRDVRILSREKEASFWLFEKDRNHARSLEGDYLRTFAIRIIAPPDQREAVASHSSAIMEFLEADLGLSQAKTSTHA